MSTTHEVAGPTRDSPAPAVRLAPPTPAPEVDSPESPAPVPIGSLRVGHAEDRAESEADAMADRALSRLPEGPDGAEVHQHSPGCDHLRRMPAAGGALVGHEGGDLDAGTTQRIESARGGGRRMSEDVLRRMETAFGQSFTGVRIHDDTRSAQLNRTVSARAFTTGQDVFFGAGEYAPHTAAGERVLAHELAHTLQNASGAHRALDAAATRGVAGAPSTARTAGEAGGAHAPASPAAVPLRRRARGREESAPDATEHEQDEDEVTIREVGADWDESAEEFVDLSVAGPEWDDDGASYDDLTADADWDPDFDEEAALAAHEAQQEAEAAAKALLDPAEDPEAEVAAELAVIDAVVISPEPPELMSGAPEAAEALVSHFVAIDTLWSSPSDAAAPARAVALAGPVDLVLGDLNDLVVEGVVDGDLMGTLAYGLLDGLATAAASLAGGDPLEDDYFTDLTAEHLVRLRRSAQWLVHEAADEIAEGPDDQVEPWGWEQRWDLGEESVGGGS